MTNHLFKTALLSSVLLLGVSSLPMQAAEISIGGGGVSVDTGSTGSAAGTSGTANVGGDGGSIARGHVDSNGNVIDLNIGSGAGPLATVDQNGNPIAGGSMTDIDVNLGALLDGLDLGDVPPGGVTPGGGGNLPGLVASLSTADQERLKLRCKDVLRTPAAFKAEMVQLCLIVEKL